MSIKTLRTLCTIVQQGSFAAAGDKLGLTQAAVSTQIRQLEEQLDVQLFDRIGRNQVLNHDGRLVLERAQEIVQLYDQLGDGLGSEGQFKGELLIGAVFSVQIGFLGPVLARLRDLYPELKIKVMRGMSIDLAQRVESGELDAVLITEPQRVIAAEYHWTTLEQEPFYVVCHQDTPAESDAQVLQQQPLIRLDPRAWAGTMIENELKRRGITPEEMMELDSLQAALMMVEQKLGVTIMALGKHRGDYLRKQFRLVPFGDPVIHRNVGVYQRQNHNRKALVDELIEQFRQL